MEVLRADPLVGLLLDGRYEVVASIARGGMATVYRARDTRLDRDVAVKTMHPFLADDPDFVARFTREARAAARISDPNVVAVHDQGTDPATRTVFLVMELVRGRTLRALLDERGRLSLGEALSVMEPVSSALAAAHASGVVHRDVKPENVLLGDDGRVLVADFGLARAVTASPATANAGLLIGTVAYLAPEQVRDGSADQRSDVYSAGVLLFELVTGRAPYEGDSPLSVAYRHLHEDVPPTGVDPALDRLLASVTSRDPSARPADGAALLAQLRALRSSPRGTTAARTQVLPSGPAPLAGVTPGGTHVLAAPFVAAPFVAAPFVAAPFVAAPFVAAPFVAAPAAAAPAVPSPRQPTRTAVLPRRRRPLLRLIVWIALLALTAGAGWAGWWFGAGRYTHAPAVVGLSSHSAELRARTGHLRLRTLSAMNSDTVAIGDVVRQEPVGGARMLADATLGVHYSLGPLKHGVPVIAAGSTPSAARTTLDAAGLAVGKEIEQHSTAVKSGLVITTAVPAGRVFVHGTRVDLIVSSGPPPVAVPDLVDRTSAAAASALAAIHLIGRALQEHSDTVPAGNVIDQATPYDSDVPEGSTVSYDVSLGPVMVTVPKLSGLGYAAAAAILTQDDLNVERFDLPDGIGSVFEQSPQPGASVRHGTAVTLYID